MKRTSVFAPYLLLLLAPAIIFWLPSMAKEKWFLLLSKEYSMEYPMSWKPDTVKVQAPVRFIVYAPVESATDRYRERILLETYTDTTDHASLATSAKRSEKSIRQEFNTVKILRSKAVQHGITRYWEILFTGKKDSLEISGKQLIHLKGSTSFRLTFLSEKGHTELFQSNADRMLSTFTVR
jgi:hypothetical protein